MLLGASLNRLDHVLNDLLGIAEHHHGFGFGIVQIAHIHKIFVW